MTSRIIIKKIINNLNLLERFPRSNRNFLTANKECKKLRPLILPYFCDSMKYKLNIKINK